MPSKVEDIYDQIVTICSSTLPAFKRLPNPYELTENTFLRLENGFGVSVGPGVNENRFVGCFTTWERSFLITLVKKVSTSQNNLDLRQTIEKDILVAQDLVQKAFYANHTLSGNAVTSTVSDDSGINFIDGDRLKFLGLEINILVKYQEIITS